MPQFPAKLIEVAQRLETQEIPEKTTVRSFLDWFGAQRRGYYVVQNIRSALDKLDLTTDPDFEAAYIDELITFKRPSATHPSPAPSGSVQPETSRATPVTAVGLLDGSISDPTQRIGKLASANKPPMSVKPDATVNEAVTKMLTYDYSQLPIMPNERDVKGVVSWASIGSRLALGRACTYVRDCRYPHHEISADTSLFAAIDTIVNHEYVLIRGHDQKISGIVTTSDLSLQFLQLGEPFLLLGEIENHIRRLISGKFTAAELSEAKDPADTTREISGISDLTFGEYAFLIGNPARWTKLELNIDRAVFLEQLEKVRTIRNDVMHFDPDGPVPADLETLRKFVKFLQELRNIGIG